MTGSRRVVLALACMLLLTQALDGSPKLAIRVFPSVAMAPGHFIVRATVEADDENRALEVTAESMEVYTSSELPLQGAASARTHQVKLPALPAGEYDITVALVGPTGRRAMATSTVRVIGMGER
ncbi:MAG: hypothetical protein U0Q55_12230 [Vicinamibacterales bacterium]